MKRKFISVLMLFAITFCFVSGCKNDENTDKEVLVVDGKEVIATINEKNYTADQIFGELVSTNDSIEYMYEQLEDLLIKTVVNIPESTRSRITNEVEVWKKGIKDNAAVSGTSYKEALATALEAEGVSTEEELIEKRIFELQEEIITNRYWEANEEYYFENYLKNRNVYHVSQILVSVGTNGNYDYFNVEPSTSVIKKLYNVVNDLLSGRPFYQVALDYSDDTATASKGGNMGMITLNDSSISNEVKYALASYSKYVDGYNTGYVPEYLNGVYGDGIEVIPEEYIQKLMTKNSNDKYLYEDESTTYIDKVISDFDESRVHAKNIIFNSLFNSRTFRFIQTNNTEVSKKYEDARMPNTQSQVFSAASEQNVLVNDEGNYILVVRSDSGIHFLSIKKSPVEGVEELKKYYSTEINDSDNYKTYVEKGVDSADREARIAEIEGIAKEYAIQSTSDNSNFAGNQDLLRYDMFMSYLGKDNNGVKFDITDLNIKKLIVDYIEAKQQFASNKILNNYKQNYDAYANNAKHADNRLIVKEIPLLSCLEDKACKYVYKTNDPNEPTGFLPVTGGGSNA